MSINRNELVELLKTTPFLVYRDMAPRNTEYPYIVYTYINQDFKRASGLVFKALPRYQVSLFTTGIESEFNPIIKALDGKRIPFSPVSSIQGDENDATVSNFYIEVGCVEDV